MNTKLDDMLAFLPTYWMKDENSNNYKFFNSFSEVLETLATNIDNLSDTIFINTSTSTYLDDLAELFKLVRNPNETDESFRVRIKNYWASYNRGGLVSNLVKILADLLSIDESEISVIEEDPAVVRLIGNLGALGQSIVIPSAETIRLQIDKAKAAGVYVQIIYSPLILETWNEAYSEVIEINLDVEGILGDFYIYEGEGELI